MTDKPQELQERLFKQELPGRWYYFIDADNVPQASIHREAVDKMMEIITDWHNKQVLEIIGEDEVPFSAADLEYKVEGRLRNKLRAEQRNKLKDEK